MKIEGPVVVNRRGEARIERGHPWVFRSDIVKEGGATPGALVRVAGPRGRPLGFAFWSSQSEIRLRMVERSESLFHINGRPGIGLAVLKESTANTVELGKAIDSLVEELRRLGGFSFGAALAWAFAIILLAVAGMRAIIDTLPDSPYWEAFGYLLAVVGLAALGAVLYQLGPKPSEESG